MYNPVSPEEFKAAERVIRHFLLEMGYTPTTPGQWNRGFHIASAANFEVLPNIGVSTQRSHRRSVEVVIYDTPQERVNKTLADIHTQLGFRGVGAMFGRDRTKERVLAVDIDDLLAQADLVPEPEPQAAPLRSITTVVPDGRSMLERMLDAEARVKALQEQCDKWELAAM